ncbi:MAG: cadherin-like beta sandwich domain-containing protein, partial [Defluviitaleaceae bacterium]|nr:cadherin-like beta sandwich domain-containing protein [Defluviitaleaceae bacterium]
GTSNAYLQQGIPIEQGAGYTVSGDFKIAPGSDFSDFTLWYFGYYTNSALFTANPDGSWTHFDLHITNTTYESTYIELFLGGSRTGTIWFDNIKLVKDGTTANLITSNPSFEDVIPTVGDYAVNAGGAEAFLIPFLDNAAANNVAVNLDLSYVNWPAWTYGPDAWPDIYAPYNQFGNKFDLENPRTWDIEKAFLDATIPIIKDNPALVSVTLSSEPAYYDDSTSVYHLQNYRDFLQNKYGAIDALNAVYGTSYLSFSEIPLPDVSKAAGTPVYYDYLTHKNDVFAQFHQMIADEIHLIAPDLPVHIKTMGWDLLNRTPLLTTGLDQEQLLAMSQISGTDNGNSRESGSSGYVQENSLYDWMMSLQKQPIFNSENHILTDGDETYAPEIAQSVGNQLWDGALHGATLSTLWVWDKSYDAVNQGYLMGSILNRPDAVQQVGKVNLDLNRLAYEVKAFQDAPAHVAILYSFSSNLYNDQYYSMYRRAYNALSYTGQKAAIITENQINKVSFGYDTSTGIGDIGAANSGMNAVINGAQVPTADTNDFSLDDYQVLILPEVTNLQADTLANIAAWVAKGGKVVTIGAPSTLLSKTELNQPQSASARSSVLDAAVPVAANPTESALRDVFFNVLGTLDLNETVVYDAATGAPADELEWRTVQYDGKTLLSIVNYTENDRDVTFKLNGADGKAVGELISANQMDGQVLRIAGLGHYIFVIEPVSQQPSNDAALASLTVSEGTLTPGFDAEITEYTVDVDNDADSIIITAAAHDPNAEVTGDTGTKNLTVGENTFTVTVTAEDGTTAQDYIITVNRAAPALIGAEVTSGPDKTVYDAGTLANIDDLDLTGLEVTFTYSDGTVNFLDGMGAGEFYSLSCDKDDFSAAGVYVVNVYADGQIIGSFTITVKAPAIDLSKYDINGDGKVDANDLALIMANLNKKASTNAVTMKCDLDGDGMVTIKDYQLLAGIIAGM